MTKTYCIFRVYDYKGGELSSNVNLSHDSFIGYLAESYENPTFSYNGGIGWQRQYLLDNYNF